MRTDVTDTAGIEPSRFDELWDFGDPARTEARFRAVLRDPRVDPALGFEIETQIARTLGLRREFDAARTLLDTLVARIAGDWGRPRARWLLERGRTYASAIHADDRPTAMQLYRGAWRLALAHGEERLAIDAAHMLAIVAPTMQEQEHWMREGLAVARSARDPKARRWQGTLWHNLGMSYHDAQRHRDAVDAFRQAVAARTVAGDAQALFVERWCLAWALRYTGAHEEALSILDTLDAQARAQATPDGYVYEEMAENLWALGREGEARVRFAQALPLLEHESDVVNDPARMTRLRSLGQPIDPARKP